MSDLRNGACPLALESLAQTGDSRRTLFYSRTDFAAGNCTGPASACRNVRKLYPGRRVIARLFAAANLTVNAGSSKTLRQRVSGRNRSHPARGGHVAPCGQCGSGRLLKARRSEPRRLRRRRNSEHFRRRAGGFQGGVKRVSLDDEAQRRIQQEPA